MPKMATKPPTRLSFTKTCHSQHRFCWCGLLGILTLAIVVPGDGVVYVLCMAHLFWITGHEEFSKTILNRQEQSQVAPNIVPNYEIHSWIGRI